MLAEVPQSNVIFFGILILLIFLLAVAGFLLGAWSRRKSNSMSLYSGLPLRRGVDLPYESARKILQFLYDRHEYDNRIFNIKRAAVCRETGRVFPDCVSFFDTIHLDWTFLRKRYPGNYVSWGSLTFEQQNAVRAVHDSLEEYQTEESCSEPAPSDITPGYAFTRPGPLYVDIETKVLLGWQRVPNSDFEVLIVQKPKKKV